MLETGAGALDTANIKISKVSLFKTEEPNCYGRHKHKLSDFFRNPYDLCLSVCTLLLLACVHSLGLELDLGNSLDWRERESTRALICE